MPIRLAIVDDYEVVVRGLAEMLRPYSEEIELVPLAAGVPVAQRVDIALFDPLARGQDEGVTLADLVLEPRVERVVVFTWNLERALVDESLEQGAVACLPKTATAAELVEAVRRVRSGDPVDPPVVDDLPAPVSSNGSWPGREHGLTAREAQVIALITQGLSNQEIAERASLSINSVKSYIRSSYRKMGVASRTNAVLWGLDHGFSPDRKQDEGSRT